MAVVIIEGLWADANRRQDWRDHISMPLKYNHSPAELIHDFIPDYKILDSPFRPLALMLEKIAKGQVTNMKALIEVMNDLMDNFENQAKRHQWMTLSLWPCADQIEKRSLNYIRGEAFINK